MKAQRGGFMVGLVVGLLIGLALALGVALYVTKVPVPFINKVPQRTRRPGRGRGRAQQELGSQRRAEHQAAPARPAAGAPRAPPPTPAPPPVAATAPRRHRRAAGDGRLGRRARRRKPGAPTLIYFAQAGAFTRRTTPRRSAPSWRCWAWTPR